MSTIQTNCLSCNKPFKSLYSLKKHRRDRHHDDSTVIPVFKDAFGTIILVPQPRKRLDPNDQTGYKLWLAGLVERINATLHPRFPGKLQRQLSLIRIYIGTFIYIVNCNSDRQVLERRYSCTSLSLYNPY